LTINPSLGPNGPTSFGNLATYKFKEWVSNLDATKSYDIGLAKPLQVSFGAEYRYDTFRTVAGDPDGYRNGSYIYQSGDQFEDVNVGKYALVGAQSSFTIRPSEEALIHRGVLSGYGDIGLYPLRRWYIGVAGRVEHYSDASGTTVGGKFNSRFDITSHFALRGTIGTDFARRRCRKSPMPRPTTARRSSTAISCLPCRFLHAMIHLSLVRSAQPT
jgi:iron complex outermembrane receptor protein